MKTIGVLGGIGPQATIDFETRVHAVAQRLIPQLGNSGYPPMVVFYMRHTPMLLDERYRPLMPLRPDPRLLDAARKLGQLADFLVVTANAPHLFAEQIEAAAGKPLLDMIRLALDEVGRRGWTRVGVLGMGEPLVYTVPLEQAGVTTEILPPEQRAELDRSIIALYEGRNGDADCETARTAIGTLQERGVDVVILGCTDLVPLLGYEVDEAGLLDPAQLLAEAAVRYANE